MKEIIGHGDIAQMLERTDRNVLFFASGVSNSQETRESEYQREKDLLLSQPKDKRLVYFGSLSIFYGNSRYSQHKLEMEELVKENFPKYCIVRLGNINWGDNPNTLINALRNRFLEGKPLEIQDTYRYVVNKEEFLHWIGMIPDFNVEMNITGRMMKVEEVVNEFVGHRK